MIHTLRLLPAYDLRAKDCGIHGVEIWASVSDGRLATAVSFYTTWFLPHVQKEFFERYGFHYYKYSSFSVEPQGATLSFHSSVKIRGEKRVKACEHLNGKLCWDAGISFLRSHEFEKPLLEGGSEGLFKALEIEHRRHFSKRKA
jgi:hypothetical protein